jgi:hypothetical protein
VLKLFVVGERSPDPETWSPWGEFSLVIAADAEAALAAVNGESAPLVRMPVCEIPMDKPLYLVAMPGSDDRE